MPSYKTYKTFDGFFADQTATNQQVITALRQFVNQTSPGLVEGSKWGNGVWFNDDLPVAFIHVEPDHLQLGFFGGSLLDDPDNILEGSSKYVRHVKIRLKENIDTKALKPLLEQAARTDYKTKTRS